MAEYEDPFDSNFIDEYTRQDSSSHSSGRLAESDSNRRLLSDLRLLHSARESAVAEEDAASLEAAWARIAGVPHHRQSEQRLPTSFDYGRFMVMQKSHKESSALYGQRTLAQRLGMLAAVAIVAVLIGSAAMLFAALHGAHSPAGSHLGSSPQQATTHLSGKQGDTIYVKTLPGSATYGTAWSPDGQRIVSWGQSVDTWDATTGAHSIEYAQAPLIKKEGKDVPGKRAVFSQVAWSPDGKYIAIVLPFSGSIQVWDSAVKQRIKTLTYLFTSGAPRNLMYVNWSADGTSIRTIVPIASPGGANNILVTYNVATGARQELPLAATGIFNRVAWSPDGNYMAVAYMDNGLIHVIDLHSGQIAYSYQGPASVVNLAWSPDSQRIVSGFGDGMDLTRVWDATTGALVGTHKGGTNPAWSPNGKYIATAESITSQEEIQVWDATTGKTLYIYQPSHMDAVSSVSWSPDSRFIASTEISNASTSHVRIWVAMP